MQDLSRYLPAPVWRERHAGTLFPTRAALDWFIRCHRDELIAQEAMIPGSGRRANHVDVERFPQIVVGILRREALAEA
jgi:hypothetical protein